MTEGNEPAYPTKKQFVDWFYGREDYFPTPHQCYDWLMENGQLSPIPAKEGLEERAEKWAESEYRELHHAICSLSKVREIVSRAYIAGAQSSLQPEWIKVDGKNYPPKNMGVLVCIPGEDYHITSGMWDVSEKWVLLDEYRNPDCEITHWMPLPNHPRDFEKEISDNYKVMKLITQSLKQNKK